MMRKYLLSATAAVAVIAGSGTAFADSAAAQKWIEQEFQPSTLSKDEQMAEMEWFINAAQPPLRWDGYAVQPDDQTLWLVG